MPDTTLLRNTKLSMELSARVHGIDSVSGEIKTLG